jgi:hypothetical protein
MFINFRAAVIIIALTATASAAENQKLDSKTADPVDSTQMMLLMLQMQSISNLAGGGNIDENTRSVVKQLVVFPMEKLYFLKMSDTCEVAGFTCGKFDADRVRPLIDIELDRRKAMMDAADKQRSFYLSLGSLAVSFCALGLSVFGLFKGKHKAFET